MRLIARRKWNTAHRGSQFDAELLDRLRSRDDTPRVDPVFADRLRAQLGAPLSSAAPDAHGPRASSAPVGRPRAGWSRPDRSRRPWFAGLLAAAMICLIVAGGLVVNAERSHRQSQPAMFAAPTTNPATVTPTPASPTPPIQPTRRATRVPTSSPRAKSTAAPANVASDGQSVGGGGDGGGQSGVGAHGDLGNGGKSGSGASSGHGQGGSESKGHANQSDGSDQETDPGSSTEDLGNSQNAGGSGEAHRGGNQSDQAGNESAAGKSPPGKP